MTSQQILAGGGWPGKSSILNATQAIALKREIARANLVPFPVHHFLGRRGDPERHHPLAVPALDLRTELIQRSFECRDHFRHSRLDDRPGLRLGIKPEKAA